MVVVFGLMTCVTATRRASDGRQRAAIALADLIAQQATHYCTSDHAQTGFVALLRGDRRDGGHLADIRVGGGARLRIVGVRR